MHQLSFLRKYLSSALICSSILFLLASCTSTEKTGEPVTDSAKTAYFSALKGVWALSSYIEDIKGTKSPHQAFKRLSGISTLIIPAEGKGDSLQIKTSVRNHLDSAFTLYFKKGKSTKGFRTSLTDSLSKDNYFTLGYETNTGDTTAHLYRYSAKDELLESRAFVRVTNEQPAGAKNNWAIDYMVKKILFSGVFAIFDEEYPKNKVILHPDGTITGFREFKKYDLLTDYSEISVTNDYIHFDTIPVENVYRFMLDEDSLKMQRQIFRVKFVKQH